MLITGRLGKYFCLISPAWSCVHVRRRAMKLSSNGVNGSDAFEWKTVLGAIPLSQSVSVIRMARYLETQLTVTTLFSHFM
jgi:hypothetical protein